MPFKSLKLLFKRVYQHKINDTFGRIMITKEIQNKHQLTEKNYLQTTNNKFNQYGPD